MSGESGQEVEGSQPGGLGENGEPPLGSTPTEASRGFLGRTWQRINKGASYILLPILTSIFITQVSGDNIPSDLGRGDYRSAAIKGIVIGVSAIPLRLKAIIAAQKRDL